IGLIVGFIASLLQAVSGHISGQDVARNQPAKLAAFEALYNTTSNAPLTLIGWVDEKNEQTHGLQIPGALSFLAHNDFHAQVTGLDAFKPEDRPPVAACFFFFHGMVAIGSMLILIAALGCFFAWQKKLKEKRWLLWLLVFSILGPEIANQLGWFAAEVGRQPWIVYGVLRTPDGLSAIVRANTVLASLILFTFIYFLLFAVFLYLLNDKIQHGPHDEDLIPSGKLALPDQIAEELK
ncbi:MAG: cytochrome ubiquinol oxidase subunit I, partial [Verrucomicrobiota bacterium]